jgi:hypothetical protein
MSLTSVNNFSTWELNPNVVGAILESNQQLCVKRIKRYFGHFESRTTTKSAYFKKYGEPQIGFTGSFFEKYSEKSDRSSFDGNDISAAISLSITGESFWVTSLLNEQIDLKCISKLDYDQCISKVKSDFFDQPEIIKIYNHLVKLNGISKVTASKLLASKRPNLFPVFDNDVSSLFKRTDGRSWQKKCSDLDYFDWCKEWQQVMGDKKVSALLAQITEEAKSPCQPLRALDIIFWLECFDRKEIKHGNTLELLKLTT